MPSKLPFIAPEPPPPDGGHDPDALPEGWPEFGELYGQQVPLRGIEHRLAPEDLREVVVDFADTGRIRPFRGDRGVGFAQNADGSITVIDD